MDWWSRIVAFLRGDTEDEPGKRRGPPTPRSGEPPVFECQSCFKVFDATGPQPVCPECDSADVRSLTS